MEILVERNTEKNGLEVHFSEKPSQDVIDSLKAFNFRWHRRGGYWYAKVTAGRLEFVNALSKNETRPDHETFKTGRDELEKEKGDYLPKKEPPVTPSPPSGYLGELPSEIFSSLNRIFPKLDTNSTTTKSLNGKWSLSSKRNYSSGFNEFEMKAVVEVRESVSLVFSLDFQNQTATLKTWMTFLGPGFYEKVYEYSSFDPADHLEWSEKSRHFLENLIPEPAPKAMSKRAQLNQEIEEFIKKRDRESGIYLAEDKTYISKYSGTGGMAKDGVDDRGVLYEFYTPDELVRQMWGLANRYGYAGGSILEPSCGTGNFIRYAPKGAEVTAYETNPISARISQILYPEARIINRPFESIFFSGPNHLRDNFSSQNYDLVIGNPPYGPFTGKYAGLGEKRYTVASRYEEYFIIRGLDLLRKDGLLVFVIPSSFLSGEESKFKKSSLSKRFTDIVDAYRLPVKVFKHTTIGTDILVLKK